MQSLAHEFSEQALKIWEIYIIFYTAFLTVNLAAIGVVVEKVSDQRNRRLIAIAFIAQNAVSLITAIGMSLYSMTLGAGLQGNDEALLQPVRLLGLWGGIGNALSHVILGLLWNTIGDVIRLTKQGRARTDRKVNV